MMRLWVRIPRGHGRLSVVSVVCVVRFQWPRGQRRTSAAARMMRLWVRIPRGHGRLSVVSVVCVVR